jgi:2-methylcitrate dehydratase PrpD
MTSLAHTLAEFVLGTPEGDIPAAEFDTAARSIFDAVGTALAGSTSGHGRIVHDYVNSLGGTPEARLIGTSAAAPAPLAALANGTFVHADDFDDMGGFGHPGSILAPALLAAAELDPAVSGAALPAAYVLGFEAATCLYEEGKYDPADGCFHATSVFGALAATAAIARLLELSVDETARALTLAASQGGGLARNNGSMVKPLHAGLGASAALNAVRFAQAGLEGAPDALEAAGGFAETYFRHKATRPARVVASLGAPYKLSRLHTIKTFPCCGSNQSPLLALRQLMREQGLTIADIEEIVIEDMPETSSILRFHVPRRGLQGKFSVYHTLATMAVRGDVVIDDFTDDAVADPEIAAARARVRASVSSTWNSLHGEERKARGNAVTVHTQDRRTLRNTIPRTEMIGSPSHPYSWPELEQKFRLNAARALAPDGVDAAAAAWRDLRDAASARDAIARICEAVEHVGH